MKKYIFIIVVFVSALVIYSCAETSSFDYQNNIIVGKSYSALDTSLIHEIGSTFPSGIPLYIRVTTKEELKGTPILLKIVKTSDGSNLVVLFEKKWFQSPDFHACSFSISKLDTGKYKLYLNKDGLTEPLTTKEISIY